MCLVPFHTITKYITNMHLYIIFLNLKQIKINEKGYILTRTTVDWLEHAVYKESHLKYFLFININKGEGEFSQYFLFS